MLWSGLIMWSDEIKSKKQKLTVKPNSVLTLIFIAFQVLAKMYTSC